MDGRTVRHFVLTLQTFPDGELADSLRKLRNSFRKLRRTPEWKSKVSGGAYVVEITRNEKNGNWHPHLHLLAYGVYFPLKLLTALWSDATDGSTVVYVSQAHGKHANHLAKYAAKPTDLGTWPVDAINEYAKATHGQRMVQNFGDMKMPSVEDSDKNPEPAAHRSVINLSTLRQHAAAGQPAAVALVKAVAARWPRLWQFLRCAIDIPPPANYLERVVNADPLQEAVNHAAKYAISLTTPADELKKQLSGGYK